MTSRWFGLPHSLLLISTLWSAAADPHDVPMNEHAEMLRFIAGAGIEIHDSREAMVRPKEKVVKGNNQCNATAKLKVTRKCA